MNEGWVQLLQRVTRDEASHYELLDQLARAKASEPEAVAAFGRYVEDLNSRGQLRAGLYQAIRDTLNGVTLVRSTVGRQSHETAPRPAGETFVPAEPHALAPGMAIGEKKRYVLESLIGRGGMGVVFKALDRDREAAQDRDPYVAIKIVSADFGRHPDSLIALQREARRAMKLAHPNIVTVHNHESEGSAFFILMELLRGTPLDKLIEENPHGLPFKLAWPIIECCGHGLAYAHEQGVVHSDFKPGNVFVLQDGRAKVLDFGIARVLPASGDGKGTRFDGTHLGALTIAYASPEMFAGLPPDPRDDVYALACVAYELLAGRHPVVRPGVDSSMQAALKNVKIERPTGLGRLQYRALVHGLAFRQAERTPTVDRFLAEMARGPTIKRRIIGGVVAIAAATAVIAGSYFIQRQDPDRHLRERLEERARAQLEDARLRGRPVARPDAELMRMLLEQGGYYLDLTEGRFNAGLLSEGVSSAYGAFSNVLAMDPKNAAAADGIVRIVKIYEAEVTRRFEAKDYKGVMEVTGYARKIDPDRESLLQVEKDARAALSSRGK